MNTYEWDFPALEAYPEFESQTDVVFLVHWRVTGTDGTYSASVYSTQSLTVEAGQPFTPYADLTKEQIQSWVQEAMGIDAVTAIQENIDTQIANLINPPVVVLPPPWASQPTV